uniref:Uncharacterized protein n=1 Tax=Malurus cyaneus samueli TaxID=2593467 RepID=A0A8C5TCC1_9PASS
MSKLSFRARDMPDLNDCVSINRAVPQMPTGMEKEEESVRSAALTHTHTHTLCTCGAEGTA